jgi:hypothetical protein
MLTCQQDQGHHIFYDRSVKAREGPKNYNGLITSFGPVMGVCAVGNTIEEAHKSVFELVEQKYFVRKNISRHHWQLVSEAEEIGRCKVDIVSRELDSTR